MFISRELAWEGQGNQGTPAIINWYQVANTPGRIQLALLTTAEGRAIPKEINAGFFTPDKGAEFMPTFFLIPILIVGTFILGNNSVLAQKAPDLSKDAEIIAATKDLQNNILEIQDNIKKLRQINGDSSLPAADKTKFINKAQDYLQELQTYNAEMQKLNIDSLKKNQNGHLFINEMNKYAIEMDKFGRELQNMKKK